MQRWVVAAKNADFKKIAEEFQIDPVIARLLRNRDIIGNEAIEEYLHADRTKIHSPHLLKGMNQSIAILVEKIKEKKKIRIIGDYDIDGVCATYILQKGLERIGARVDADIPDRIKDGYGISNDLIELALEDGIDTIITCDNGISALEQVRYAKEQNLTVVITDHHEVPEELPAADAIINPKQEGCPYPFKELCGAGVAYQVVAGLYSTCQIPMEELEELLVFAGIATVGDVMNLLGENRVIVKEALLRLQKPKNIGLQELIRVNQLEGKSITAYHIGFVLGPCINASGRLSTAKRALALLLTTDREKAAALAGDLKALNDSRKSMTAEKTKEAVELVEHTSLKGDKVLVVYLSDCHESLAGIIAGRIRECYGKPTFVLTKTEKEVKGSGRSIEAYSMFEELQKCENLLKRYGGHPMAAGLSIEEKNVEVFRKMLNEHTTLQEKDFMTKVMIDVPMPISYITQELVKQLSILEPFGKGNTKPLFAQKNLRIMECQILGKNRNVVKMQVADEEGYRMDGIYFGDADAFVEARKHGKLEAIAYYPSINSYRGKETLQIVVENIQ